jgi:energy-coupling factor transport system permease protein
MAGVPLLAVGVTVAVAGALMAGRRSQRTRYRPDPWLFGEWLTVASGLLAAVGVTLAAGSDPIAMNPVGLVPLVVPAVPVGALLAVLLAAAPAALTPVPPVSMPSAPRAARAPAKEVYA